jgi:iron complex transport system substrate-binding protein
MPASALLLAARVASLNLCTDEYLLLLARPDEIASVSYLSQEPLESPLWKAARRHPGNSGSVEAVLRHRPRLLLTMGGGGRATSLIARRMSMRALDLTFANSPADVAANFRAVASALGEPARARPWLQRIARLQAARPAKQRDAIWLYGGGLSIGAESGAAQWLRLAGLRQRPLPAERATLETLLIRPPSVLLMNRYRTGQLSAGQRWLDHPIVRNSKSQRLSIDGRAWRCAGPLAIAEVERLRTLVQ